MDEIKRMDIKEFREKGYLQEINRCFLHPLGLALEITIAEDGVESLGGIWDYREDAEGNYFDFANRTPEQRAQSREKMLYIEQERERRDILRQAALGFIIEGIKE